MSGRSDRESSSLEDPFRGPKMSREVELGSGELWTYRSEQVTLVIKAREAQVRATSFGTALRCPEGRSLCLMLVSGAGIVIIRH